MPGSRGAEGPSRGRLVARVSGLVQGVGFRYATIRQAHAIGGITGYVRNASDGSVEVVAEGDMERLRRFESWLGHGPPGAAVRSVEALYDVATGHWASFGVEY